jgi:nitrite reductase/ring-hydroxylating ferredoxin subunit
MTTKWIANGLSHDLPRGVVMAGEWQGADLAIWRSATGRLSAWGDRCPHRGMRLSHGFVRGETLACIYHGWVYGTDGACRHIPAHPALQPPATIRAQGHACVEAGGVIWVAPEGAEGAPEAPGGRPLRSMTFLCSPAALAEAGGLVLRGDVLSGATEGGTIWIALQALGAGGVRGHALCGAQDDPVAASRWLEGLRRRAEAGVAA